MSGYEIAVFVIFVIMVIGCCWLMAWVLNILAEKKDAEDPYIKPDNWRGQ